MTSKENREEEKAFLEGALGALQLVSDALDSVEQKYEKAVPEKLALNLLREKLDMLEADIAEFHHLELKRKLIVATCILP